MAGWFHHKDGHAQKATFRGPGISSNRFIALSQPAPVPPIPSGQQLAWLTDYVAFLIIYHSEFKIHLPNPEYWQTEKCKGFIFNFIKWIKHLSIPKFW